MRIPQFIIPLLSLLFAIGITQISAQSLEVDKDESRLWIEGHSNVNEFRCNANQYETNVQQNGRIEETNPSELEVGVDIIVESFDCGRSRMNRDLREALKADRHRAIQFRYLTTQDMRYNEESDTYSLLVEGLLTVAGTEKNIVFEMTGELINENKIKAYGQTKIDMSDFNIEPPVAMLGLIKVRDRLTVHFNLLANYRDI